MCPCVFLLILLCLHLLFRLLLLLLLVVTRAEWERGSTASLWGRFRRARWGGWWAGKVLAVMWAVLLWLLPSHNRFLVMVVVVVVVVVVV